MEKDCWTCKHMLDLGHIEICLKWKCEIRTSPDVHLFCKGWKKNDDIYDYDAMVRPIKTDSAFVPRKE